MWLTIDLNADVPIYTQIRNGIIEGILTGELKPGESLPSVRQLASDLGINLHTVNKAYGVLKQEGFIRVHRKKGAVINSPESYRAGEGYYGRLRAQLQPLIAEARCRGVSVDDFTGICGQIYEHYQARRNDDG